MTTVNLSKYAPKDLVMDFGKWQITSPVPDAERGKKYAALLIAMNAGVSAIVGEEFDKLDTVKVEGVETEDDINRLTLGSEQVDQLLADGCPPALINRAGGYALTYWTWGEDAANSYMQQITGVGAPKGNRAQRRARNRRRH